MTETLGRLQRVELRHVWNSEARDFTPWLAREDNLALLGNTLGIELELEAVEESVGPFRADILCKDALSDRWVLIENQLERTDHTHLGQLLTYAAGLDAVTIVWVAARAAEEHRAAIDWLNEITESRVGFFLIEVELWRIDDSPAAPKFNIVSQPNDWSRSTSGAKKAIESGSMSESKRMLVDYWTAFEAHLGETSKRVRTVAPLPQNWLVHSLGKSGVTLNASWNRRENWVRGEVYLTGPLARDFFGCLKQSQAAIEAEFGEPLTWYDKAQNDRRIWLAREFQNVTDTASWPEQHEWLAKTLDRLHQVFHERVKRLDPEIAGATQ